MIERSEYLTVTELTKYLKRKFDVDPYLNTVYLTGEISNFRLRPAHQYFSIKDDHAKINAIMFRSAFSKVKFTPEEGMKVLVTGHIGLYEPSGSYQIYIDHMEPDGLGSLYQAYEQLKAKLSKEGIFKLAKRPLAKYPNKIAVITSQSGSVIRDIITTTRRRNPLVQLVLFPALVQGDEAAKDLVKRLKQVNELGGFDTIIIGRGGGSIEDLWPFNDEELSRTIANSKIPVISSVGHETDTTLADLAADVRAATPTAAAELATPVLNDMLMSIQDGANRLNKELLKLIHDNRKLLMNIENSYVLKNPQRLYESYVQNLSDLVNNLVRFTKINLDNKKQIVTNVQEHLTLDWFKDKKDNFHKVIRQLDLLSPLKIMQRGYGYVTTKNNEVIKSVEQLKIGEDIDIHFSDGTSKATVNKIAKE